MHISWLVGLRNTCFIFGIAANSNYYDVLKKHIFSFFLKQMGQTSKIRRYGVYVTMDAHTHTDGCTSSLSKQLTNSSSAVVDVRVAVAGQIATHLLPLLPMSNKCHHPHTTFFLEW
jgi:hypothetical protein